MAQAVTPLLPPPPPPPPPPLPPPPPSLSLSSRSGSGSGRLRSLFWERIPQERVEGRRSVWTKSDEFLIDLSSLDELFGQQQGLQIKVPGVRGHRGGDKHTNTDVPQQNTPERISILEGNRSLKVGIFLHHFKSSLGEIINDIREGRGQRYGNEKLRDLYRLLPECEEEKRLRSFRGESRQLEEADLFMIRLVEIPSFRLRLEAMILQEEFDPAVTSVSTSARCLATAATELMSCVELHSILRLVLKAGNYMNAGGFAGNAAGFRISSLLKLADTKANRPGMNLLHFVAMEAVKRDPSILSYHLKLHHLGPAARLSVEAVQEEFAELQCRVTALLEGLGTAPDLQSQLTPFLQAAELKLSELQADVGSLYEAQRSLLEFFCEDDDGSLKLEEACATFHNFQQRFLRAAQENELREKQDLQRLERQQTERRKAGKHHSIASCSILEAGPEFDDEALEMILRAPVSTPPRRSLWTSPSCRTPQRPALISLLETPAEHSPPGNEARTREEVPDGVAASKEAAKKAVETRTGPERTRLASPSPTPGSARSSGHSPRNLSPSHTLGVRLRPHVGETHILVSGLRSYSSLAPPTGGADQEDKTQQTGERLEEAEPEVREVTSSHTSRRQRGKLGEWTTRHVKAVNQSQSRTHMATPLPRTSRLPLPLIGQQIVTHSGTVGGASEREGPKAKLPQPLKRLLDRASSRKEKDQREKEKERREKEREKREKEVREKQKAENDKERKAKGEKEREMLEREKEKKEKEREKEKKEKEREKEKKEKEREKEKKEKEREKERKEKEREKERKEKERDRGAKGRSMERSLSPASALAMSMSRPLSRLCPAAAPIALASIRYTAKALHSALKRDSSGGSSRIPAPTSTRTPGLPRSDTDSQHA